MTVSMLLQVRLSYVVGRSRIQAQRLNGYKTMKVRKNRKDRPGQASSGPVEFHQVNCPGCGKFIKKIKKQKEIVKEDFECSSCTTRFSLTFPGTHIDKAKADWLRGEGDEFTDFKFGRRR